MDKIKKEFNHWFQRRNIGNEHPIIVSNKEDLERAWIACGKSKDEEINKLEAENKKLRDALSLAMRELKTAMVGYRRAANKTGMKGYDLAESTLWDMFNFAVNNAETILKDGE